MDRNKEYVYTAADLRSSYSELSNYAGLLGITIHCDHYNKIESIHGRKFTHNNKMYLLAVLYNHGYVSQLKNTTQTVSIVEFWKFVTSNAKLLDDANIQLIKTEAGPFVLDDLTFDLAPRVTPSRSDLSFSGLASDIQDDTTSDTDDNMNDNTGSCPPGGSTMSGPDRSEFFDTKIFCYLDPPEKFREVTRVINQLNDDDQEEVKSFIYSTFKTPSKSFTLHVPYGTKFWYDLFMCTSPAMIHRDDPHFPTYVFNLHMLYGELLGTYNLSRTLTAADQPLSQLPETITNLTTRIDTLQNTMSMSQKVVASSSIGIVDSRLDAIDQKLVSITQSLQAALGNTPRIPPSPIQAPMLSIFNPPTQYLPGQPGPDSYSAPSSTCSAPTPQLPLPIPKNRGNILK
jgi:hypothetical protein